MEGKESTQGTIGRRFSRAIAALSLYAAIMFGFISCGEESVEPEPTGVTGTILPSGIAAAVKIMQNDVEIASTDVDPEGKYVISDLAEGEYNLVVIADGYKGYSQTIEVTEEQIAELEEITLQEEPPGPVIMTGKVTDLQTDKAISDALVLVEYEDSNARIFTYTKRDGSFTMIVQRDLVYDFTISKASYESFKTTRVNIDYTELSLAKRTQVGLNVGNVAPNFMLPRLDGGRVSLHDTRGKVVIIGFCASYFGPCVTASPYIQRLYEKYRSRGLVVLGIDVWQREGTEALKRFRDENGLTYDILLDSNGKVALLYKVKGTPSTWALDRKGIPCMWLLDRKGIITWIAEGFDPGGEVILEQQILAVL